MKFVLEIELSEGDVSLCEYNDIRETIRATAYAMLPQGRALPSTGHTGKVVDSNGNPVGKWEVVDSLCA